MQCHRFLFAPFAALLLLIPAACGGETESAFTEYFERVEALTSTLDDRSAAQEVGAPNQVLGSWVAVLSETAGGLEAIEPPLEVADAHQELIDAIDEAAAAMRDLSDQHPDVQSLEEAAGLRDESEAAWAADQRARSACAELRDFAEENGVEVDLELC